MTTNVFANQVAILNKEVSSLIEQMNTFQKYSNLQFEKEVTKDVTYDEVRKKGVRLASFTKMVSTWEEGTFSLYNYENSKYLLKRVSYVSYGFTSTSDPKEFIFKVIE